MDDFVKLGLLIVGAALGYGFTSWLIERRRAKREEARQIALLVEKREEKERILYCQDFFSRNLATKYTKPSTAPNARATVLKMRKEEVALHDLATAVRQHEAIADALILQSFMSSSTREADPEPIRGHGGTFDGGGSSGDWSSSSSDSSSSSSSSSDSSSSSSSSSSGCD